MIIDSSALVAILSKEPEAARMARAIAASPIRFLSAGNLLETSIVIEGMYGEQGGRDLDLLLAKLDIAIEAFTLRHADLARKAYRKYGKGRHPAKLNFGDTFAYALAKETGEPLLFKGSDFFRTDIVAAPY